MKNIYLIILVIMVIVGSVSFFFYNTQDTEISELIVGGDRDEYGCLVPAGYAFDDEVRACIRSFEMTPDIMKAASLAASHVGEGYALTVVLFNSYEEVGSYDIVFERGEERAREIVYIRGGQVVEPREVKLYYYNAEMDSEDGNILCSEKGLVPVLRTIAPTDPTLIETTIRLLLEGELTAEEKMSGISTEYPLSGFGLEKAELQNGVLTLEFSDAEGRSTGGSCRVSVLWLQIEATAKQFDEVKEVRFLPEEIFQP